MKYIIYAFIDMNDKPYYIGKTNNLIRRRDEHLEEVRKGNKLPKYTKIREILKKGGKFKMQSLAKALNEADAYLIERTFIKEYLKRGFRLTNMTEGGPWENPLKLKDIKKKKLKIKRN